MGVFEERRQYLQTQASQLISRLELALSLFADDYRDDIVEALRVDYGSAIEDVVRKYKDDHLAHIAVCGLGATDRSGNTRLRDVQFDVIGWNLDGREHLVQLVKTALIAGLVDLIWARLHRKPLIKCRFCDFTIAKEYKDGGVVCSGFDALELHIVKKHRDKATDINKFIGSDEFEEVDL